MASRVQKNEPFNLWKVFVRLQNPFMKWLLESPLHVFVSKWYLLVRVTGRKTGKVYTTPVQYKQDDDTITIISSKDYQWWRNLNGGAELQVRISGKEFLAWGGISDELTDVEAAYDLLYPQMGGDMRLKLIPKSVVIRLKLHE